MCYSNSMSLYLDYTKNETIFKLVQEFNSYLNIIVEKINLPDKWTKQDALEIEIKKSFIRGLLRYSNISVELSNEIKKIFCQNFPKKKNVEWISLAYPMIHLPNDASEDGGFHNDGIQNDFFTSWIPVTNYEYEALSIFNYQNIFIDLISKIIIKSGFPKFFSKNIKARQGNIFFWDARRIHKGNINTSNSTAVAIQVKLTSKIYEFEQSRNFISNSNSYDNKQFINFETSEIIKNYDDYKSCISFLIENISKYNDIDIVKNISNKIKNKSMHFSFGLSVLAQRILSKNKLFSIENYKQIVRVIDLTSMSLGSANLVSLQRLISHKFYKSNIEDELEKVDRFNSIPFSSHQFLSITDKLKHNNTNNYFSF